MKILYPKPFNVITSEATQTPVIAQWAEGSYNAGSKVTRSVSASGAAIDYIFEAGIDTTADPATGSLDWVNKGASDPYKVFDEFVSSRSAYASGATLEIGALKIDGVFLCRLNGSALFEAFDYGGSVPFFTQEIAVIANVYEPAVSWTTYFFREPVSTTAAKDILIEMQARITGVRVRLTARTGGFTLGKIVVGVFTDIGDTRIAPTIGVIDFSIKSTDDNGNTYIKERSYAKRASIDVLIKTARFDQVAALLSELRAKPTVYIADNFSRFSMLSIYGIYRDFSMLLSGEDYSECSLEIEGLT